VADVYDFTGVNENLELLGHLGEACNMWMRSPGLGKTELYGHIEAIGRQDGWLIAQMKITDPVKWRVRVAMDFWDVMALTKIVFKSVFFGVVPWVLLKRLNDRDKLEDY